MEVLNELLGYPHIKIYQDPEAFNFSLDSMLLADFATIKPDTLNIIDLGTGNAPIPLYLTLRTKAKIIGVEIQEHSYNLALKSVLLNKLDKQITIINDDVRGINKKVGCENFDLVLSNPPFFKCHKDSNLNKNDYKTIARHEVMLNLDELCAEASSLLKYGGLFAMVHRPDRLTDIIISLKKHGLDPKRIRFVYPKAGCEANHVLIEARKSQNTGGLICESPLIIHNSDNTHTKEILEIYNKRDENVEKKL